MTATVKINISIPKKLGRDIKNLRKEYSINVSFICTKALEAEVAKIKGA